MNLDDGVVGHLGIGEPLPVPGNGNMIDWIAHRADLRDRPPRCWNPPDVGTAPAGRDEEDLLSVGRPLQARDSLAISRQLPKLLGLDVDHEEVAGVVTDPPGKGDSRPIG